MSQCGHTGRGHIDKASCQGTDCQKCCHSSCYAWGKLPGRGKVARHKVLKLPCMGQVAMHGASYLAWGKLPCMHACMGQVALHKVLKLPCMGQVALHGVSCQEEGKFPGTRY